MHRNSRENENIDVYRQYFAFTCTLDSPGWEKEREKNGFHILALVMSKLVCNGEGFF